MNARQRRTLARVDQLLPPVDIPWSEIISLLRALGAELTQGSGSRVRVSLNGVRAVFHAPHPGHQTPPERVRDVRRFLENAGVASP